MNKVFGDSNYSDSFKLNTINHAGLDEAQHNYFSKYANSGFSEINNTQKVTRKVQTKIISPDTGAFSKIKNTQNQVLRQLKQQYQILRNLPIDDNAQLKSKPKRQITSDYSSSIDQRSDITSSKKSQKKKGSRDAQILALQKKQLQIVISNSLKKIQQLLQNQMELKKVNHQLRLQIQGKGGVNSQYQLQIRNLKKRQKQLLENIDALKMQNQRKNSSLKQLGQKVAFLEGQKSRRQHQHRSYFDSQRQMDDMLRKQKDKSMNAQLQIKRIQMEFQIYQKDKTAEINRLTRQLQTRSDAPQRDAQTIRRLQQQIRAKEHKIQTFVEQIESLRTQVKVRPVSPTAEEKNRNVLQELVKQMKAKSQMSAKDNNEAVVRALIDKLGARKDEGLKNQLSSLRSQLETLRRNSTVSEFQMNPNQENELKNRVRQLQRIIQEQKRQKRQLYDEIQKLKTQRDEIDYQCQSHRKKVRQYKDTQQRLLHQIQQLSNFKIQLQQSKMQNIQIKQKLQQILINPHELHNLSTINNQNRRPNSIDQYQDQIRSLNRKVDQLTFALNKVNQQRNFSQNMLRQSQNQQASRMNQDLSRYKLQLKNKQQQFVRVTQNLKNEIQLKNNQIQSLTKRFQQLDIKNRQALQASRNNYQSLLKAEVAKHYNQLQAMNQKIIQLTRTNQNFTSQGQYYASIQREVNQLRRLTRNSKRANQAVDHLWEIKQAEYGNINQILNSVR